MMKNIFQFVLAAVIATGIFSSCSEESLGESIFDTNIAAYDEKAATAPFDEWLYNNFVVPYNTTIDYKLNLLADLGYQLSPADYKKSQLLAQFIKHLFYDVYVKYGTEDFMKTYAPRSFHFIGSKEYSPSQNTETLGYASGGVKITLINVNGMKPVTEGMEYDFQDMQTLNKDQFHVMHHEFSHILHQVKQYPVEYGQITPKAYDAMTWQKNDSTLAHSLGFVTHYSMSASTEDFVEVISCTITDSDYRWMTCIIDACLNGGVKNGDKERIYEFIKLLGITDEVLDDPNAYWNNFDIYEETATSASSDPKTRYIIDRHIDDAKALNEDYELSYKKVQHISSFRNYLDSWVQIDSSEGYKGMNAILAKFEKVQNWYSRNFKMNLFELRQEVRERQDDINTFIKGVKIYDLKKTADNND